MRICKLRRVTIRQLNSIENLDLRLFTPIGIGLESYPDWQGEEELAASLEILHEVLASLDGCLEEEKFTCYQVS